MKTHLAEFLQLLLVLEEVRKPRLTRAVLGQHFVILDRARVTVAVALLAYGLRGREEADNLKILNLIPNNLKIFFCLGQGYKT